MTLAEPGYQPRLIDEEIALALQAFGAIAIEGPKFCGKTWTGLSHANSVTYIADPAGGFSNRTRAALDPTLVLQGDAPHMVDEWQEVPGIWDAVRFTVDRGRERGRFILTGSTMPPKKSTIHSGAGRIESVRMRTMSLFESGLSSGEVSLQSLIEHRTLTPVNSHLTLETLLEATVRGGWPESTDLPLQLAARIPHNYLARLVTEDMTSLDGVTRDPSRVRATLASLARNTATLVSNATIERDVDASDLAISRATVGEYLAAFKRLYVLEEIPAWAPATRSRTRLRKAPKRFLTDPSLAVAALGLSAQKLYADLETFGFIFEAMCLRDLAIYSQYSGNTLHHFADETGLDADAIIEGADGSWTAVEIKLGHNQVDSAASKLLRLEKKLVAAGAKPPACLVVITGLSSFAHQREDGVFVVPIDCLRP
jgi:predicted AAA+ superfamily ATPase